MSIIKLYKRYQDKWWALPLILPTLLLPLARAANTFANLNGHTVLSSAGVNIEPDAVFRLGGDSGHYSRLAADHYARNDLRAIYRGIVSFFDPLSAVLGRLSYFRSATPADFTW